MSAGSIPDGPDVTAIDVSIDEPGGDGSTIGRITLARPEKLNALSRAVLEDLAKAAAWFDTQDAVEVVVVSGAGRSFSAGFDLSDRTWSDLGPPERSAVVGRAMADAIGGMRAVTVAAIRGHCIGGGLVLASACDLRLASDSTSFRIPEINLGIPLYWSGVPRLTRELGAALTKELVMTGRVFDAEEAKAIRFVNRVVPDAELDDAVDDLAAELAAKATGVLVTTKEQVEAALPSVPAGHGDGEAEAADFAHFLGRRPNV